MLALDSASPVGKYTVAQLEQALRAGTGSIGCRFDVTGVPGLSNLTTVTAATVEWNVDRTIKGSLTLTMWPEPALLRQQFKARITPWFQIRMPDDGIAEWPLGVYIWTQPKRNIQGTAAKADTPATGYSTAPDTWTVELLDQLSLLNYSGPPASGYTIPAGTRNLCRPVRSELGPLYEPTPTHDLARDPSETPRRNRLLLAVDQRVRGPTRDPRP
jgi:hypothetical protein